MHLWPKLTNLPDHCDLEVWGLAFARRQYCAALRRRFDKPMTLGDSVLSVPERTPDDAPRRHGAAEVLAALRGLDPQDASFLAKRLLDGLSFATIAGEAELSISMVKSRFYRSVSRLRQRLRASLVRERTPRS